MSGVNFEKVNQSTSLPYVKLFNDFPLHLALRIKLKVLAMV